MCGIITLCHTFYTNTPFGRKNPAVYFFINFYQFVVDIITLFIYNYQ